VHFASDNTSGVAPPILDALVAAASGYAPAYGDDELTLALDDRFGELFEHEVRVFPVVSGTAANSLALSVLTPPWGLMLCHEQAHVYVDEAGAPEHFTRGARLVALPGAAGKIDLEALRVVAARGGHGVHTSDPSALTLTQATELGTVYTPDEVAARAAIAHEHGLGVHMDGARFANAVASLGCTPADLTWRSGVDLLSFGATKNGAMGAEAVVVFDLDRVGDLERNRKRAGHLLSKMRYASAQLHAYIADGLWLQLAAHANGLAADLSSGLAGVDGVEVATPTEANEVFAFMPDELIGALEAKGAAFYVERVGDRPAVRLVVSWSSTPDDVEAFLAAARSGA
jgi:threonine aldolase